MTSSDISTLRKELAQSGDCPFSIAAAAIDKANRLQERIAILEAQLRARQR